MAPLVTAVLPFWFAISSSAWVIRVAFFVVGMLVSVSLARALGQVWFWASCQVVLLMACNCSAGYGGTAWVALEFRVYGSLALSQWHWWCGFQCCTLAYCLGFVVGTSNIWCHELCCDWVACRLVGIIHLSFIGLSKSHD